MSSASPDYGTAAPWLAGERATPPDGSEPVPLHPARLNIVRVAGTLLIRGELDLSTRDLLTRTGHDVIADWPAEPGPHPSWGAPGREIVLDAAGLRFIDAAGVGGLIRLRAATGEAGGTLRIIHPSPQLRRITEICHLDAVLAVQPVGVVPQPAAPSTPSHDHQVMRPAPVSGSVK